MKDIIASQDLIKNLLLSLKEAQLLVKDIDVEADIEVLHRFRVKLRYTRGILQTFNEVFPQEYHPIRKQLKKIMKPTNPIRDNDVFIEYLKEVSKEFSIQELGSLGGIFEIVSKKRVNYYQEIDKEFLYTKIEKLMKKLKKASPTSELISFSDLKKKFNDKHKKKIPLITKESPEEDFHKIRVSLKALRYSLECFATLTKKKEFTTQLKKLKKNQNSLGELQDANMRMDILESMRPKIQNRESLCFEKVLKMTQEKKEKEIIQFLKERDSLLETISNL